MAKLPAIESTVLSLLSGQVEVPGDGQAGVALLPAAQTRDKNAVTPDDMRRLLTALWQGTGSTWGEAGDGRILTVDAPVYETA